MTGFYWIGSKIISNFNEVVRPNVDNNWILKIILELN